MKRNLISFGWAAAICTVFSVTGCGHRQKQEPEAAETPTYEEVFSHTTGHAETVHVVYDPEDLEKIQEAIAILIFRA